jgi:hypothetical protein
LTLDAFFNWTAPINRYRATITGQRAYPTTSSDVNPTIILSNLATRRWPFQVYAKFCASPAHKAASTQAFSKAKLLLLVRIVAGKT